MCELHPVLKYPRLLDGGATPCRNFNSLVKESAASEQRDMIDSPDVESHVFCRVLTDCGAIAVDNHGCASLFLELRGLTAGHLWLDMGHQSMHQVERRGLQNIWELFGTPVWCPPPE